MNSTGHRRHPQHAHHDSGEAIASWREVAAGLTPVIGTLGYDALFERSLRAVSGRHAWLAGVAAAPPAERLHEFELALASRSPASAAAAQVALQNTFGRLLEHLIGRQLALRLLRERVKTFPLPRRDLPPEPH